MSPSLKTTAVWSAARMGLITAAVFSSPLFELQLATSPAPTKVTAEAAVTTRLGSEGVRDFGPTGFSHDQSPSPMSTANPTAETSVGNSLLRMAKSLTGGTGYYRMFINNRQLF